MLSLTPPRHTSTLRIPALPGTHRERLLRVELSLSTRRRAMTAICAERSLRNGCFVGEMYYWTGKATADCAYVPRAIGEVNVRSA